MKTIIKAKMEDADVILKKDDNSFWVFPYRDKQLCIIFNDDGVEISIMDKEEVRRKMIELANKYWTLHHNKREW
jgi:glutamine synthetase